jgi:hypothetical protein
MLQIYKLLSFSLLIALSSAFSQTTINLRTQSRDVDFTNAAYTRPFKSGTALATACSIGDAFLKTDAPPGQNLYICTNPGNPGTWTVQGSETASGSSGVSDIGNLRDFTVSFNAGSATVGCPSGLCQVRIGEKVYQYTTAAVAAGLTGTGASTTVYFYLDASGVLTLGYDGVIVRGAVLSGLTGVANVTNAPANSIPLAHCAVTSNQFTSCSDDRALLSRAVIDQGTGITLIQNPATGHTTVAANPSTLPFLGLQNTFSGALNDFSSSQLRVTTGSGIPSSNTCGSAGNVGYVYVRNDARAPNASYYVCSQTGTGVYSWELTQGASGTGSSGGSGSGSSGSGSSTSLSVSGPYLTDGTNYWIQGTGQLANLFNNSGFAFNGGAGWTYSTANHVGILNTNGVTRGAYEIPVSGKTTLTVTFGSNLLGGSGSSEVFIGARNSSSSSICNTIADTGTVQFGSEFGDDTHYTFLSEFSPGHPLVQPSPIVTLRLTVSGSTATCALSTDGGVTFNQYRSGTSGMSGALTFMAIGGVNNNANATGNINILSWSVQ